MDLFKDKNLKIKDPGEYDVQKEYKKREISILDGSNKLELIFRDNKLSAKTFTYNNNSESSWFYSNYHDILDAKNTNEETHGIWKDWNITKMSFLSPDDMGLTVLATYLSKGPKGKIDGAVSKT